MMALRFLPFFLLLCFGRLPLAVSSRWKAAKLGCKDNKNCDEASEKPGEASGKSLRGPGDSFDFSWTKYAWMSPSRAVASFLQHHLEDPEAVIPINMDKAVTGHSQAVTNIVGFSVLALIFFGIFIIAIWWACKRKSHSEEQSAEEEAREEAEHHAAAAEAVAAEGTRDEQLAALKAKKGRIMMDQVLSKRRLQVVLEQILRREAELKNEKAPTPEEIRAKTEEAIQATNIMAEKRLLTALAYIAPFAVQGKRIQETMQARAKAAQEKLASIAYEESINMCNDLQGVFEVGDIGGSLFQSISKVEVPSLVTILASAFAPAQLRLMFLLNVVSAAQVLFLFLLSALVWLTMRPGTCKSDFPYVELNDQLVPLWFEVDMVVSGVVLVIRAWVLLRVNSVLTEMDAPPPMDMSAAQPVQAVRKLLDFYLTTGAEALASLDAIGSSVLYAMANWAVVINLAWSVVGADVVLNTNWSDCKTFGLVILRAKTVFFFICLIPQLVYIVFFFATHIFQSDSLKISLMTAALEADKYIGIGIPLVSIVVQSFMVTNRADTIRLRLRVIELRKSQMKKDRDDAELVLKNLAAYEASADSEIASLKAQHEQVKGLSLNEQILQDIDTKNRILGGAETIFKDINDRAKLASVKAEAQVREWEQKGDGPADYLKGATNMAALLAHDPTAFSDQMAEFGAQVRNQPGMSDMMARAQAAQEALKAQADAALHSDAVEALRAKADAALHSEAVEKLKAQGEGMAKAAMESEAAQKLKQKAAEAAASAAASAAAAAEPLSAAAAAEPEASTPP